MTGKELKTTRLMLGVSMHKLGRALGYTGNRNTVSVAIGRFENGSRPIPTHVAQRVEIFVRHPEELERLLQ